MMFGYITLFTALILSLSAAVYSILGLTAIFAAAFWPIVVLGGSLEIGKIVTVLWLHKYWPRAELQYKVYLSTAVLILMVLTSMGVFGFLSKAHLDQAIPSGDVQAKVQIFDDKIKTQRDNIEAARKALTQMDVAVDQTMGRSTTEQGADKAAALRRTQGRERGNLQNDITKSQKEISNLQEQRAPIAAEMRKVEAEVGPIKYIAALIYGDAPDANVLEKAVRWVIILIVLVFDPLALTLLLAATKSFEWEHSIDLFNSKKKKTEDDEWSDEKVNLLNKSLQDAREDQHTHIPVEDYYSADEILQNSVTGVDPNPSVPLDEPVADPIIQPEKINVDPSSPGWMFTETTTAKWPFPGLAEEILPPDDTATDEDFEKMLAELKSTLPEIKKLETDIEPYGNDLQQQAMRIWKSSAPNLTYKEQFDLLDAGKINRLPWEDLAHHETLNLSDRDLITLKTGLDADNEPTIGEVKGFGINFPGHANKGDMFLRVDNLPSQLYKYNGTQWIRVNKNLSDGYIYDDAYIEHLIQKVGSGEYDPDLLSDIEKERIAFKLRNSPEPK